MPIQIREGVEAYPVDVPTLEKLERTHNRVQREHIRNPPLRGDDYNEPQLLKGELQTHLQFQDSAIVSLYELNGSDVEADTGSEIEAWDWMLTSGKKLASGSLVVIAHIGPRWYVIASNTCPSAV